MKSPHAKANPVAALFLPRLTTLVANRGWLEIAGWCNADLRTDGFSLVATLGKRRVHWTLSAIPALRPQRWMREHGDEIPSSGIHFFRTELKIGKGLKRISFHLEHADGRTLSLGRRTVIQQDRVTDSPESVEEQPGAQAPLSDYDRWRVEHEPALRSANDYAKDELVFPVPMLWVVELHDGALDAILQTLHSIHRAAAGPTEICIVDDRDTLLPVLRTGLASIPTVQVMRRSELKIRLGRADADAWVGLLQEGDCIDPDLPRDFFRFLSRHPETALFYTDFDHQLEDGSLGDSHVLPEWNRDLLHSYPYIGTRFLMQTKAFLEAGGLGEQTRIHDKWALQLRFSRTCKREQVGRLCGIYFHLLNKYDPHTSMEASELGSVLLREHHEALGNAVEVSLAPGVGGWRTRYMLPTPAPKVSLLIPTRDGVSVLRTMVDSILEKTSYANYEILILDNDSELEETHAYFAYLRERGCRIVPCPGRFNYSQINNRGTMEASGELYAFLNNDLEVIEGDWLEEMVSHACRPDVGAVGAKLLYPDGSLQHAGVLIGVGHVAAHAFRLFPNEPGEGPLRAHVIQNYSAVTAACLVVRAEVFREVGGFDDVQLAITNNDVDLCIKIREAGYRNVYTPYAVLYHHESATRGPENTPEKFNRYQKEVNYMWKHWSTLLMNDPAYNRLLTRFKEDFSLAGSEELQAYIPGKIF
ncbi:MAG: glycosyltransferase family 2 protein [Puniceicoccaceae bacterium]